MVAYLFDEQYEKQIISKMQTNFRGGIWIRDKETEYALEGKLPSKTGLHCNRGIFGMVSTRSVGSKLENPSLWKLKVPC